MQPIRDSSSNQWLLLVALSICLGLGGCQAGALQKRLDELRGPGFTDAGFANMRPVDPANREQWGFSTKARQIEANVGIR
jgi:hypothetical protein